MTKWPPNYILSILIAGILPAAFNWPWTKGMSVFWLALWGITIVLRRFGSRENADSDQSHVSGTFAVPLQTILLFLICSASIWSLAYLIFPTLHPILLVVIWAGLFWHVRSIKPGDISTDWISKKYVSRIVVWLLGIGFLFHGLTNLLLGNPFHGSVWTSALWAALAFVILYPEKIDRPIDPLIQKKFICLCPALFLIVMTFHGTRFIWMRAELIETKTPAELAARAFQAGYSLIGMNAAIHETGRLEKTTGWAEAVQYHRKQWQFVKKERLARAFRDRSLTRDNLFLFAACYGCDLQLQESDEAIDVAAVPEKREFWILTSKGRLLRLGNRGVECLWESEFVGIALAVSENGETHAVLTTEPRIAVLRFGQDPIKIEIRVWEQWKDIAIDSQGTTIWSLDGMGRIEAYHKEGETWSYQGVVYEPLWQEPDIAQALLRLEDGSFLILDAFGGIHWRSDPPVPPDSPVAQRINQHFNPERRVASDLGFWEPENHIAMADQLGFVYFLSSPITPSRTTIESATNVKTPPFIRGLLSFDIAKGVWNYNDQTIAIATLPEVNSIYKLHRNGVLQAVVMPQRFYLRYTDRRVVRFNTKF